MRVLGFVGCAIGVTTLLLSGCTSTTAGHPQGQGASGGQSQVPRLPDRPVDAVLSALRQLDACALFDPAAAFATGFPANAHTLPTAPHKCAFTADPTLGDELSIELGTESGYAVRFSETLITVGNAKAYLRDSGSHGHPSCELDIPVSFKRSIRVASRPGYKSASDPCAQVKAMGAAVASKLADPDKLTVDPTTRPLSGWDGCALLESALGQDLGSFDARRSSGTSALDGCSASPKTDKASSPPFTFTVEIKYNDDPLRNSQQNRTVGDKQASVSPNSGLCSLTWNQGPSGVADKLYNSAVVKVYGPPDCDKTTDLATKIVQKLGAAPPKPVAPQRPLLYTADQPDNDAPGACADFVSSGSNQGCNPYQPVNVPSPPDQILAAGAQDPAIGCALAADAVREVYGTSLQPVTWASHCFFVEPTHALTLMIDVDNRYAPNEYGNEPSLYANRQTVSVAGKQAVSFTVANGTHYDIYVSPTNKIDSPGMVSAEAQVTRPRGTNDDVQPDTSKLKPLDDVMAKIVSKYFK